MSVPNMNMVSIRLRQIFKPTPGALSAQWHAADALYYLTGDEAFATAADELLATPGVLVSEPAPSGWISVKDRLPEVGQGVIAYRPTAQQTSDPTVCVTFYSGREKEDWQGVKHSFDCLCHPSHWMPLPAAPQVPA